MTEMIPDELINLPDNPMNEKRIMQDCPDCDGDGERLSDCCGASGVSDNDNGFLYYGICPSCHEYCEFIPCETCDGTGEVEMIEDEIQDMKDSAEDDLEIELCKKYCNN